MLRVSAEGEKNNFVSIHCCLHIRCIRVTHVEAHCCYVLSIDHDWIVELLVLRHLLCDNFMLQALVVAILVISNSEWRVLRSLLC